MTVAEKRKPALQFMAQEQQRIASTTFSGHKYAAITDVIESMPPTISITAPLRSKESPSKQFQKACDDASERGHSNMLAYIESVLDRDAEITDEEISVEDIIERARHEAHVDVSQMASISTDSKQP